MESKSISRKRNRQISDIGTPLNETETGVEVQSIDILSDDAPSKDVPSTEGPSSNKKTKLPSAAVIERRNYRKLMKNKTLKCTACVANNDAEFIHPLLSIPICGSCYYNVQDKSFALADDGQELRYSDNI
jgi:hypothetical protein